MCCTLFLQVLFSKAAEEQIRHQAKEEKDNRKREAAKMLENTIDLINQVRTLIQCQNFLQLKTLKHHAKHVRTKRSEAHVGSGHYF